MGKPANPKRTTSKEARAYGKFLKTSERKLNLLAQMIRGQKAGKALTDLQFSKRRIAGEVRKLLQSAVANAENNHGLDVDRLVVAQATVGRMLKLKRYHARARGRASPVEKKFSNMTIIVREQDAAEAKPKKAKQKPEAKSEAKAAKPAKPKAKKAEGAA